jgi:hypothetical protein
MALPIKETPITMEELKIGDRFRFINTINKNVYTLIKKTSGYVGEFSCPFIILDTQCSDRPYIPLYRIVAEYKGQKFFHAFTIDYKILKISPGIRRHRKHGLANKGNFNFRRILWKEKMQHD